MGNWAVLISEELVDLGGGRFRAGHFGPWRFRGRFPTL